MMTCVQEEANLPDCTDWQNFIKQIPFAASAVLSIYQYGIFQVPHSRCNEADNMFSYKVTLCREINSIVRAATRADVYYTRGITYIIVQFIYVTCIFCDLSNLQKIYSMQILSTFSYHKCIYYHLLAIKSLFWKHCNVTLILKDLKFRT